MFKKLMAATALISASMISAASAETISMWVRSGIGDSFKEVVKAYNAGHENKVELTEVPFAELVQKYATAIAGGQAPDALSLDLIYTPAFAAAGQLEDLTDWSKALPYFNSLSPSHVKLGTYEDKIYGLPLTVETSIFAWNKDLYEKAGLDPEKAPKTWEEITANAEKIRALGGDTYGFYFSGGGCGGCMIFTFTPLTWGAGADILSADGKTATLDTPQMRKAVDIYRNMVEKDLVPAGAASDNGVNFLSFTNGKIGQQSLGAFAIGTLVTQHPEIDFGVTLIPGVDGKPSSFAGGDNFVVTKGTPRLEEVKEFLEYTYSPEGQKIMAKFGSLPTRGDIANEVLEGLDPRLKVGMEAIAVAQTPYTLQFNDLINSANGPWATFTNAAIYGDDVDGAFSNAQDEMQSIIDAGQ
ncbi:sugar ABC transporter substrate-binding protein (plasmid) [Sinorhizobium meliloti WSM1022]|jgi:multiple sugar transport system substrate-binding protein|uniref:Sugar uptake ABC transporter periplasmic solute-binding protein n=4 Tax=Rhizobium meliloti TaxID=382 RepID=Q926E0_RHIME|nr:sugar ABC transporter substrate-binding protein [Sinorhizobium meliloti]TWA88875.1 carbohydrate ABC transporter substrate-binding protein (CUT1 family) [Ensifer sp. SEMIA 134]TWB37284.1 carbohydrate ABC transporter substrate-binding protein (CUT1 family) [Ensifer sp. SEMIA 135]AEG55889.1 extracellular solute-binding protein family 1 [Sinorhizobium meliloti AK83]AEH82908.1 putative sugar uptake ABC transporter periplasmic solute-binding protein precursor [Sinorhizobium meliloti SM11]AGG72556